MAGLRKNFVYQSIYQITSIVLPLVTSPYVSRVLGAQHIGIYSYTYSIVYYFSLFALLGIQNHGNRAIASVRDEKFLLKETFSNLLAVHCVISGLAVIVYYAFVFLFIKEERLCAIIQGIWILGSLADISWLFLGLEKFKLTVISSTVIKILSTICVFAFIRNSYDLWKYCLILATGNLISQLILWLFIGEYVDFRLIQWNKAKQHMKPLLILFVPAIAVSLYKYMDKIMLGLMTTKMQVGFYENAERAINIPISIIGAFGTVMLPKMSNLAAKEDIESTKRYIMISMEFVMCLAVAMSIGMAAVANNFAVLFWGEEFSQSGLLICILSISVFFVAFANILRMQYLIPQKMDWVYIVSVFSGALVNLLINSLLIKKWQAVGAAIGTVGAELSVCVVQAFCVRKELPIWVYIKNIIPFGGFGAAMYCFVALVGKWNVSLWLVLVSQIVFGVVSYCLCCFVYFRRTNNPYYNSILDDATIRFKRKKRRKAKE